MLEDRDRALGGLRVGDRLAHDRVEQLVADVLLERDVGLARMHRAHVGDVEEDAKPLQVGVQAVTGELDDLQGLLDALQREVLRLGAEQGPVGGDERVDREQAERRRAVDQDEVVALRRPPAARVRSVSSRPILPAIASSASASVRLAGMIPSWIGRGGVGAPGEDVADRRARPRDRRRSSPTGCPADRGRRRGRRAPPRGRRRSACGQPSSCRCRPSGRGPRSVWATPATLARVA